MPDTNEQVKCEECKHYIDDSDAQKVLRGRMWNHQADKMQDYFKYYCPMHRKPYDIYESPSTSRNSFSDEGDVYSEKFYKIIPEHRERVNEDGTPYKEPKKK